MMKLGFIFSKSKKHPLSSNVRITNDWFARSRVVRVSFLVRDKSLYRLGNYATPHTSQINYFHCNNTIKISFMLFYE
jgi:hypothetical protein